MNLFSLAYELTDYSESPGARRIGSDWPTNGLTMIGMERLLFLRSAIQEIALREVPGDVIECGVWRGGACIFMRACLDHYGLADRKVYACDSFAGLPPPDPKYPADRGDRHHTFDRLRVSADEVRRNFRQYDMEGRIELVEGLFEESLPRLVDKNRGNFSLLRIDADMYSGTFQALTALYPWLSLKGICCIDDAALKGARAAMDDYRRQHNTVPLIERIDWTGVYWRKQ